MRGKGDDVKNRGVYSPCVYTRPPDLPIKICTTKRTALVSIEHEQPRTLPLSSAIDTMFRGRRFTKSVQEFISAAETTSPSLLALFAQYTANQKTKREFSTPDDFYLLFNDFAEDVVAQLGKIGTEYTRSVFAPVASSGDTGDKLSWYKETLYDAFTERPASVSATISDAAEKTIAVQEAIVEAERKTAQLARLGERLSGQYNTELDLQKLGQVFAACVFAEAEGYVRKEPSKLPTVKEWTNNLRKWQQEARQMGNIDTTTVDTVLEQLDENTESAFERMALTQHRDVRLKALQAAAQSTAAAVLKGRRILETAAEFAIELGKWNALKLRIGTDAAFHGLDVDTRKTVTLWIQSGDEASFARLTDMYTSMGVSQDWSAIGAPSGPMWATLPSGSVVKDVGDQSQCWAADLVVSLPSSIDCKLFAYASNGRVKNLGTIVQESSRSNIRTMFALPAAAFAEAIECAGDRDSAKIFLIATGDSGCSMYTFSCSDWPVSEQGRSKPHVVQAANIGIVVAPTEEDEDDLFEADASVDLRFTVCDANGQIVETANPGGDDRVYYASLTQKRELPSDTNRLRTLQINDHEGAYFSCEKAVQDDSTGLFWDVVDINGNTNVPATIRRAIDDYPSTPAQFVCLWSPGGPDPKRPGTTRSDHLQFFSIGAVATYVRSALDEDSSDQGSGDGSIIVSSLDDSATSTSLFVGGTGSTQQTATASVKEEISQEPLAVAETSFPIQNHIEREEEVIPTSYVVPRNSVETAQFNHDDTAPENDNLPSINYFNESKPHSSTKLDQDPVNVQDNELNASLHADGPAGNSSTSEINSGYFEPEQIFASASLRIDPSLQQEIRKDANEEEYSHKLITPVANIHQSTEGIAYKGGSSSSGSSGGGRTSKSSTEVNFVSGKSQAGPFSMVADFFPDQRAKSIEDERSVENQYDDSFASEEGLDTFLPGVRQIGDMFQTWQNAFA